MLAVNIDLQGPLLAAHAEKGQGGLGHAVAIQVLELNQSGIISAHHGDVLHLHTVLLRQTVFYRTNRLG